MYQDDYKRWLEADLLDYDLKKELQDIEGDDNAIKERFAVKLEFGTAGLRGTLGAEFCKRCGGRAGSQRNQCAHL